MPKISFTPKNTQSIIALVRKGSYINVAAQAVGVSARAVFGWLSDGKDADSKYHQFYLDVQKAKAEFEIETLDLITQTQSPKYLLEVLSRQNPTRWSSTSRVTVEVKEQIEAFMGFLVDNLQDDPIILEKVLEIAMKYSTGEED